MGDLHPSEGQLKTQKPSQIFSDTFVWATRNLLLPLAGSRAWEDAGICVKETFWLLIGALCVLCCACMGAWCPGLRYLSQFRPEYWPEVEGLHSLGSQCLTQMGKGLLEVHSCPLHPSCHGGNKPVLMSGPTAQWILSTCSNPGKIISHPNSSVLSSVCWVVILHFAS